MCDVTDEEPIYHLKTDDGYCEIYNLYIDEYFFEEWCFNLYN